MTKTISTAEVSAVGFSMEAKLNDKRSLVMQMHMASDASKQEMFALLEKLCSIADALDTRYRLIDMRLLLERAKQDLPVHERKLDEFERQTMQEHNRSSRRGDFEWKGQAKTNRDNLITTVAGARVNLQRMEKGIAEAEAELAEMKDASSGTADRKLSASNC